MIEPLENRIAPSAVVTFTDIDGDLVTITSSEGTKAQLETAAGDLTDHRLQTLDLTGTADFDDTNLSIVAKPQAGKGDGFVNVGRINATGRVLGKVTVDGDLGVIDVGNTAVDELALQGLRVQSFGEYGRTVDLFAEELPFTADERAWTLGGTAARLWRWG